MKVFKQKWKSKQQKHKWNRPNNHRSSSKTDKQQENRSKARQETQHCRDFSTTRLERKNQQQKHKCNISSIDQAQNQHFPSLRLLKWVELWKTKGCTLTQMGQKTQNTLFHYLHAVFLLEQQICFACSLRTTFDDFRKLLTSDNKSVFRTLKKYSLQNK